MFWTVPLSIIRSFSLYTQQWYMSYRFASRITPLLCVQWKTTDDGQRNCPKHVEFYSKNKFEKLVHLVGFIIRIYHDARSSERQKRPAGTQQVKSSKLKYIKWENHVTVTITFKTQYKYIKCSDTTQLTFSTTYLYIYYYSHVLIMYVTK